MNEDDGDAGQGGVGSSSSRCSSGRRRRWCGLHSVGVVRDEVAREDDVGERDGDGREKSAASGTTRRRRRGGMGGGRGGT